MVTAPSTRCYSSTSSKRVVILAPRGRDGSLMAAALAERDFEVYLCAGVPDLITCIDAGAGVLLLTIEALEALNISTFQVILREQPPWSDLPIVLLAGNGERPEVQVSLSEAGNVTVLERPVRLPTLIASIQSAVRARQRQYEMRDLLLQSEIQQAHIEALNERLQRAMTETHHRVKNNLQVISAIIDLRLLDNPESLSVEEFRRLSTHVRMLAAVHDLLTANSKRDASVSHVSAKEILEKLFPIIQQTATHMAMELTVDDVRLPVRQAASLTLIVNELVSNAIKHGSSRIDVRLFHEDKKAVFEVCDDGPGFPPGFDPSTEANTGLELVENISRWDLTGSTRYDTTNRGGRVTLTFPV
jgi:two-component sensor histidine kinase